VSELEQWLRAAMHAAVTDEEAPANLAELVRRRHRRHRVRSAAAAAVAVLAISAGATAVHAGAFGSPRFGAQPRRAAAGPSPLAAPPLAPPSPSSNFVENCSEQIAEQLPAGWQRQSLQAGPLWFVDLRPQSTSAVKNSQARTGGLLVLVRSGVTAWVTVVGAADGYFRFLFGPGDFTRGADGPYTINSGESEVTFTGCGPGGQSSFIPGYTEYGGYYLVTVPQACVTLEAWSHRGGTPYPITFGVDGARCESS
jgi:hypothetical protein